MKPVRVVLAAMAALLALAACSSSDGGTAAEGTSTDAGTGGGTTIATAFGDVEVPASPERIVALGWGDAETVLALGFQPVGALEPDLILDVKSSGDQARYDRLSSIAPTVGIPEGAQSYPTSREDQVQMIAAALGVPEKGDELLAQIDEAFSAAAAAHPDWAGQTVTAAIKTSEGWGAYVEGSERVGYLENLGFVQSPTIAELPDGATGFSVDISSEQLNLLDADLIVAFPIFIETTQLTDDPLWQRVPAVADGRAVVIDGDLSSANSLGSTLSITYAIDNLVPLIEEATS